MKVLVTGGTGFIGGALVKRLLSQGSPVRVLVRDPGSDAAASLKRSGVEVFKGDVTDSASCIEACRGVDVVFHCAGVLGGWGKPDEILRKVNVEGTRNMLEAASRILVPKFVHVSSCGILGSLATGEAAGEDHPYNPINSYEETKAEAEKLALSFANKGMHLVVVRPEFVYGPGDFHLLSLFRTVQNRRFIFFNKGRSTLHPTYIDDVLDAMSLAAKNPRAEGLVFNIAGERPVTVKEFISSMAGALGVKAPGMSIPAPLARITGIVFDSVWGPFGKPPLTADQVGYLTENRAFNITRARKVLGYSPKIMVHEGMRRTVEWYRAQGLLG